MDSSQNLDSPQSNSTTSTATALHLTTTRDSGGGGNGAGETGGGGCGGGGLAPPRNLANRRTSLADIISRVRRTSAGLQTNNPLQPLTESKSELPQYSIPGEKFADKRVKVTLLFVEPSSLLLLLLTKGSSGVMDGRPEGTHCEGCLSSNLTPGCLFFEIHSGTASTG